MEKNDLFSLCETIIDWNDIVKSSWYHRIEEEGIDMEHLKSIK